MAGSMFSRVKFPTLVQIATSELTRISNTLSSSILELLMHSWAQSDNVPASGVVSGMVCSDSGAGLTVAVSPGLAFRHDGIGVDPAALDDHAWRLIALRAATTVTLDTGDPTNDRIDRICVTDSEADANQRNVPIWDPDARVFVGRNRYLDRRNTPSVIRVTGTPDPSPVAPAAPAGYLSLATVRVPDGATDLAACTITDARTLIRGPGLIWRDMVKRAGDIMTGGLVLPLLTVYGTPGARQLLATILLGGSGLWVDDTSVAAPKFEVRGTSGATGTWFTAGLLQALGKTLLFGPSDTGYGAIDWVTAANRFDLGFGGVVTGARARSGALEATDDDPAPGDLAAADMGTVWRTLVPWAVARVVAGDSPEVAGGFNIASVSKIGTGDYVLELVNVVADAATVAGSATAFMTDAKIPIAGFSLINDHSIRVVITDSDGAVMDADFCVTAYALSAHA